MIIVYSETRGQFLGDIDWVHTPFNAKSFNTTEEARQIVRDRTPRGKTETIAILAFVCREVVGLTQLFTPKARARYRKSVTG